MPTLRFARHAALLAAVCAAFSACSSPTEVNSEGARSAKLQVSPSPMDMGSTATTAVLRIENPTKRAMSWTAEETVKWLSLEATSGTVWAGDVRRLTVTVSRTGLSAGTHTTDLTVTGSNGGGTEVVPVSVVVPSSDPTPEPDPEPEPDPDPTPAQLSVSPLQADFGTTGTSKSVGLSNTGGTSLSWTATESVGWLSLRSSSGTIAAGSSQTLSLTVDRGSKTAGTYTTTVQVDAGAAGSATVSVTMTVPSTSTSVLLAGRVVDQFGNQGLGGLSVQFGGETTTTAGDGSFSIPGSTTSSPSSLTISGNGVYRRVTQAKTGDAFWGVVPNSFDIRAFDDIARDDFGSTTVRWTGAPKVYVDSQPEGFEGGPELQTWISQVQVQAADFVAKWTGHQINPGDVTVTSSPPKDFTSGTIVIHFSELASRYNNQPYIGYARLSWTSSRSITGAAVWLRYLRYSGDAYAGKRKGILGHELGHAMGFSHMDGSTYSFMAPSLGSKTDLSAFDAMAALLVYNRLPGNASADIEGTSAGKSLSASAFTVTEWVCSAGVDEPQP